MAEMLWRFEYKVHKRAGFVGKTFTHLVEIRGTPDYIDFRDAERKHGRGGTWNFIGYKTVGFVRLHRAAA